MKTIPLKAIPNQILTVLLDKQICRIELRQKTSGLYLSLWKDNVLVQSALLCLNGVKIVHNSYNGFLGALKFTDKEESAVEPYYTGLGTRYQLVYVEESEL